MRSPLHSNDPRVKRSMVSWGQMVALFAVLIALAFGQSFIIVDYFDSDVIPPELLTPLILYWASVAVIFSVLTTFNARKRYEKPIKHMSEVTKRVADGDFTAQLEIKNSENNLDYLDVVFLDFNKMVKELASIEILKNDFVSNVSHEIKTPLSVIQNYATLLQSDSLTPEQRREYTEVIFNASEQLSVLVSNILRLSKLENESIHHVPKVYDVCRQLGECILNHESMLEAKQIDFSAEMEDKAMAVADESMVEIIWNNLLSNAIKFTDIGGRIELTQTSDDKHIIVSVRDSGCGMSAETLKHIFDKFYQGDTSHQQKGNGLGLALVKKVIDLCGGEISVESELGKGSVFTVKLEKSATA